MVQFVVIATVDHGLGGGGINFWCKNDEKRALSQNLMVGLIDG